MRFEICELNGRKAISDDSHEAHLFELYKGPSIQFLFRVCARHKRMIDDFLGYVTIGKTSKLNPPRNAHINIILPTKREMKDGENRISVNGNMLHVYFELIVALSALRMGRYITIEKV